MYVLGEKLVEHLADGVPWINITTKIVKSHLVMDVKVEARVVALSGVIWSVLGHQGSVHFGSVLPIKLPRSPSCVRGLHPVKYPSMVYKYRTQLIY